jgi:hypothetical protein
MAAGARYGSAAAAGAVVQCMNVCIREARKVARTSGARVVTMSPCGQLYACDDGDTGSPVRVWRIDGDDEKHIGELKTSSLHPVKALEWSQAEGGRWICTTSDTEQMVTLWDWHGRASGVLEPSMILRYTDLNSTWTKEIPDIATLIVCWSPARDVAAFAMTRKSDYIVLFDATVGVAQKLHTGKDEDVSSMIWTRDGQSVIYASQRGNVYMMDILSGRQTVFTIPYRYGFWEPYECVTKLALSFDGRHIVGSRNSHSPGLDGRIYRPVEKDEQEKSIVAFQNHKHVRHSREGTMFMQVSWCISGGGYGKFGFCCDMHVNSLSCSPVGSIFLIGARERCALRPFTETVPKYFPYIPLELFAAKILWDRKENDWPF